MVCFVGLQSHIERLARHWQNHERTDGGVFEVSEKGAGSSDPRADSAGTDMQRQLETMEITPPG